MSINNISGNVTAKTSTIKAASPTSGKEPVAPTNAVDKIDLPLVDRLNATFAASTEAPINGERVASLRQAINNGEYKVDADRVAKKIMQFESALPE